MRSLVLVLVAAAAGPAAPDLTTVAERSAFHRTGRYEEVERLCAGFQTAYPGRARCFTFGRSPEGRPLLALAASEDGVLDPALAGRRSRPVILFEGGIHAGEIDGKDAGFWLLRELLAARERTVLTRVTALFVPVFNVDGHERFSPHNRPNQRGPEEMGFRTTAANLNLNRDWTKAEAPEMAAMLELARAWDPTVFVDLHVTDGARFEHDISVVLAPQGPAPLGAAARVLGDELMAGLTRGGHLPLPFYPSLRTSDDPASGFEAAPLPPRYSHSYFAARNRLGVLVETHSWKPYAVRVRATRDVLDLLFRRAAVEGAGWRAAERAADQERLAGAEVPLAFTAVGPPRTIDFRGYAYTRQPSEISGAPWVRYDEAHPQIWRVPLYERLEPRVVVRAPRAGYLVPAAEAGWLAHKLDLHGVRYRRLTDARDVAVDAYRADTITFASAPFEGRFGARVRGRWRSERRHLAPGALFVPVDQPRARLLLHLLEPEAPDSFLAWGFFHAAFEQKEEMESYVAEEEARKMLARDPALRADFEARLKADPTFAKSPRDRLAFFARRHPSWDERMNLYPVLRVDTPP